MWDPRQGKHIDILRYPTEELCNVATQYTTSSEAAKFHLALGIKEATLSSGREAPLDVAIQSAREGVEGSKRRCKNVLRRL
jgi:hypothetical protein